MKIQLDANEEWGYFINPVNFQIGKIINEVPNTFFVLIKKREFLKEMNITIIRDTFGRVKNNKLEELDKRSISDLLSVYCAKYILKHNRLPPSMKIEPELKYMKPAKLAFFVGNYDVFHLKIDVDLLGGKNPKEVLDIFIKNVGKSLFTSKRENRLKIECARSGRVKCKKCNETIEKEFIRLGEPFYYQDHLSFRWFHENCIDLTKYDKDMLAGLEVLSENDRKRIEKKLKK